MTQPQDEADGLGSQCQERKACCWALTSPGDARRKGHTHSNGHTHMSCLAFSSYSSVASGSSPTRCYCSHPAGLSSSATVPRVILSGRDLRDIREVCFLGDWHHVSQHCRVATLGTNVTAGNLWLVCLLVHFSGQHRMQPKLPQCSLQSSFFGLSSHRIISVSVSTQEINGFPHVCF